MCFLCKANFCLMLFSARLFHRLYHSSKNTMSNENFTSANLSSSPPGVDDNSNTSNISSKNDVSNAATPANINNLGQNNVNKNKYTIEYCNNKTLHSSSPQLECKNFAKKLFQSPSDRHVYALVFSDSPVR